MESVNKTRFDLIGVGANKLFDESYVARPWLWKTETKTTDLALVLAPAFSEDEAPRLASVLLREVEQGATIKLGGRQVRRLFGCQTKDIAGGVRAEAHYGLSDHQLVRMSAMAGYIGEYPDARMIRPDIDFFQTGVDMTGLARRCQESGLKAREWTVSGGAKLVEVVGEKGSATMIDKEMSWQTGEMWPMYGGVYASLDRNGGLTATCRPARFDAYPLDIPKLSSNPPRPDDPNRVAAVARALMWGEYSTDRSGRPLNLPPPVEFTSYFETIAQVKPILARIEAGEVDGRLYSSAFRDLSLAFLSMTQRRFTGWCPEGERFYSGIFLNIFGE